MLRFICLLAFQRQFTLARSATTIRPLSQNLNNIFEYIPKSYKNHPSQLNKLFSTHQASLQVNAAPLGKINTKLRLAFTCKKCNTRNDKLISKVSYTKGIVLVRYDGCQKLHLIADNLDWFKNPQGKNIEEILASKGETVKRFLDPVEEEKEEIVNKSV